MDNYELRALELEAEQLERFEATNQNPKFWEEKFEAETTALIERLRRNSVSYNAEKYR